MSCEFSARCWRYSYSRYLQDNKGYPGGVPPDRFSLVLDGYASQEQSQTYVSKDGAVRNKGIYCKQLPMPGGGNHCPEMALEGGKAECGEYIEETGRLARLEAKHGTQRARYEATYKRAWIAKDVKCRVARKYKFNCAYCGRHYTDLKAKGIRMVYDHVVPLKHGGSNTESNLAYCCYQCNSDKGDQIWAVGCRVGYYADPGAKG